MKKILPALIIVISIILVYFIFNKETKIECSKKSLTDEYTLTSKYKVYYKNKEVYKILIEEAFEASTSTKLDEITKNIDETYKNYQKEIGSYEYTITKNKNKAITKIIMDYNKMDMEAYIKYNPEAKLNNNKRYNIDDLKEMYEERGIICK